MLKLLAFDYGASSGRAILGKFDGNKLFIEEIHRFSNDPVVINSSFYWDILRLFYEMKIGVRKSINGGNPDIAGIGIDAWGVDFGLLDANGDLLGNPYHYRDNRTECMIDVAADNVSKEKIYNTTGIAFQKFNSIYQLLAMKEKKQIIYEKARSMLFIPDLLNYFLTGEKQSEFTIASTSQMLNIQNNNWADKMLKDIGISNKILTEIINPGTIYGKLTKDISDELNIKSIPVIAVCEHDTGSAVVSVPASNEKFAYISSGTWSLLGIESEVPIINDKSFNLNYTNEGGINKSIRFLKNIMGLWILQECKREWDIKGEILDFNELRLSAEKEKPFGSLINPDNDVFYCPGQMPEKIINYCRKTEQKIPESKGEIVRCILESLALKYRMAVTELEDIIGYSISVIHIVGGGSRNIMLNQFTANATGKRVISGPVEATAIGNIMVQLLALGKIKNLNEIRSVINNSFSIEPFEPRDIDAWSEAYERFKKLVKIKNK